MLTSATENLPVDFPFPDRKKKGKKDRRKPRTPFSYPILSRPRRHTHASSKHLLDRNAHAGTGELGLADEAVAHGFDVALEQDASEFEIEAAQDAG